MDPWATSLEFMDNMASIMRNSILCAIGTVKVETNTASPYVLIFAVIGSFTEPSSCPDTP